MSSGNPILLYISVNSSATVFQSIFYKVTASGSIATLLTGWNISGMCCKWTVPAIILAMVLWKMSQKLQKRTTSACNSSQNNCVRTLPAFFRIPTCPLHGRPLCYQHEFLPLLLFLAFINWPCVVHCIFGIFTLYSKSSYCIFGIPSTASPPIVSLVYPLPQFLLLYLWYTLYSKSSYCIFGIPCTESSPIVSVVYPIQQALLLYLWYTLYIKSSYCICGIPYTARPPIVSVVYPVQKVLLLNLWYTLYSKSS